MSTQARAAAVIPRLPDGRVLVGTRTKHARSWPGTIAFPGGACELGDEELPLLSDPKRSTTKACALRELGEETGLWRLCGADGAVDVDANLRAERDLLEGRALVDVLGEHKLVLDDRGLLPLVLWKTWDGRFGVQQMLLELPAEPRLTGVIVEELATLRFEHPAKLHDGWRRGEVFLIPPIRRVIVELARTAPGAPPLDALRAEPNARERARHDLVDGVCMLPAKSPTLPPATHTNAVLLGNGDALLVDPATPWAEEQERFDRQLQACLGGHKLTAIVCTHHHIDHVGDVERLRDRHRCPVWAHPLTAERVDFRVDRLLDDGDVIEAAPRRFRVVFTPGHARGHICLFDEETRLLVAGDMVAGIGSIIIDPPEGHMGTYLASLQRLIALRPRALIPSHGPLLTDGTGRLQEQLAHREKRQAAVLGSVPVGAPAAGGAGGGGGATIASIVQAVYGVDTPPSMWAFAERSVLAALELAQERQEVITDGKSWWRIAV